MTGFFRGAWNLWVHFTIHSMWSTQSRGTRAFHGLAYFYRCQSISCVLSLKRVYGIEVHLTSYAPRIKTHMQHHSYCGFHLIFLHYWGKNDCVASNVVGWLVTLCSYVEFHVLTCDEPVCLMCLSDDGAVRRRRNSERLCSAERNKRLILTCKLNKHDIEVTE